MLRHALFGPPGSSDLSTERREQLAIAVEPVANPSFIFMDEPTSGLDGQAAAIVMRTALTLLTLEEFVLFTSRVLTYLKHLMSCLCIIYGGKPGTNSRIPIDYFQVETGRNQRESSAVTWGECISFCCTFPETLAEVCCSFG
ncbi:ABC transporter G family member 31 isoform X1 [Eucalyptus grandis]|uniref:ABC transporter G family member 31 isoform X1 n=1 Tax=Eucalyptus grandis TaxID=71139 RepID=UPI00192E8652|nr:ABC transporter G family member 31 isoform X1 [Eucalyptus grandis]